MLRASELWHAGEARLDAREAQPTKTYLRLFGAALILCMAFARPGTGGPVPASEQRSRLPSPHVLLGTWQLWEHPETGERGCA